MPNAKSEPATICRTLTGWRDYGQAQKAARAWWRAELRREEGHDTREGPFTVRDAIADYLKAYEQRGGKAVYDARRAAETHILPALGTALVGKLTAKKIEAGTAASPSSQLSPVPNPAASRITARRTRAPTAPASAARLRTEF
jgi:hypothetical protein